MTSANTGPERLPPIAILAGGLAKRLRPTTETIPKSMVPVAGEPFIAHQLRLLRRERITNVVVCTGYLGNRIEEFVGDGHRFGCRVRYTSDGEQLLGTGGAIRRALPLLGECFFVMYGDSYLDIAFEPVYEAFLAAKLPALMTVFRNSGKWDTSNVEFTEGVIRRHDKVHRTPAMQYIDFGLGVFKASAFAGYATDTPFDLSRLYSTLAEGGQLAGYEAPARFYEIGSPAGLAETTAHLAMDLQSRNK
jgi:NDP-sugar pyrophosphorylase family protein